MTQNTGPETAVWPTLLYRDAPAAIRFLTEALGFEQLSLYPGADDGVIEHAEFGWPGGGGVMLSSAVDGNVFAISADGVTTVYLVSDTPDELFARATAAGARVVRPPAENEIGSRGFTVADPEDNLWSVGTYRPAR
jgi:uncharacterized glyoxalase superfamily protein PhnB